MIRMVREPLPSRFTVSHWYTYNSLPTSPAKAGAGGRPTIPRESVFEGTRPGDLPERVFVGLGRYTEEVNSLRFWEGVQP